MLQPLSPGAASSRPPTVFRPYPPSRAPHCHLAAPPGASQANPNPNPNQVQAKLTLTLSQVQAKLSVAAGRDGRAAVALQLNTRLWTVAPREPGSLALTLTLTLTLTGAKLWQPREPGAPGTRRKISSP